MKILFLHGWNSVVGGVKPTYLKDHGHEVINPALPHEDFEEAVRIAQAEFDQHRPQVVVGSSRGGAVAMNINSGDARLVLLCPAWKKYGTARTVKPGTVILHSRADDVVPFADSEELAKNNGATLIEVGNDHRLADPEPLAAMLRACDRQGTHRDGRTAGDRVTAKTPTGITATGRLKGMEQSPQEQIEAIVRSLEAKGVPAAPVVEATALATVHPEAVADLAIAVMHRFPKGGTFLDGALSYLPQEAWPELVRFALDTLERSGGKNAAAESVIEYASLQCPSALHPHLDRLFVIRPNARCYYERYPWRESGDRHLGFLRAVIQDTTSTDEERTRAWTDLCETRHAGAIEYALSCADHIAPTGWSPEEWIQAHLHLVGLHQEGPSLRRLCPDSLLHLVFPEGFFEPESRPPWLARIHPTWKLPVSVRHVPFGGSGEGQCSLCAGALHRLLVLDPIPPGLGVTGRTRLELATCLSCLGWERQPLFYRHDPSGSPSSIGYDGPRISPQFPVGPLREAVVGLAETPRRWFWQVWGCSNSRENLNRIGGEPCWVQDAEYPRCPTCDKVMGYLLQLDSDLPTADGGEWLWGSGGIAYGFWCDPCGVSGFLWQCT